jgi:hypothetical protein
MKKGKVPPSGKRSSGKKGMTTARQDSLRSMAELAQAWDRLEDWEREEWWKRAPHIRIRVHHKWLPEARPKARTRGMLGEEYFVMINRVLRTCGYERRRLPPPPPNFRGNPVKPDLRIVWDKGRLVIKVRVRAAPATDIMVFGAPPRRAGQRPGGHYAFLGLLPVPKDGTSDIGEMYLTKLKEWRKLTDDRYQVPLAGARICIRTWPQDNGWESKGLMVTSQGLVPRSGREAKREKEGPEMG